MKLWTLLRQYFRGIRVVSVILAVTMFFALIMTVAAYVDVYTDIHRLAQWDSYQGDNLVFYDFYQIGNTDEYPKLSSAPTGKNLEKWNSTINDITSAIAQNQLVDDVLTGQRIIKGVSCNGVKNAKILIYDTAVMDYFPNLIKSGIDFSNAPDGCIILNYGSEPNIFCSKKGDTVTLKGNFSKIEYTLPVIDNLTGYYLDLHTSATPLDVSDLLSKEPVILVQNTETVMRMFAEMDAEIQECMSFYVLYKEGTTKAQRLDVRNSYEKTKYYYDTELATKNESYETSKEVLQGDLLERLPLPLFLLFATLIAYFGIVVLTAKKKQKEISFHYLCGASRLRCMGLSFWGMTSIALIPVLLITALILLWEPLAVNVAVDMWYRDYKAQAIKDGTYYLQIAETLPALPAILLRSFGTTFEIYLDYMQAITVDSTGLWIVFAFYGITALVAFLVTWLSMRKHSPLTYLRGVNE